MLKDIRGGSGQAKPGGDADAKRASISSKLETGQDDPLKGVANISRDSGGTKSYGNFGLNSGGSAQKFVAEYGDKFGLTAKPGTKSFDEQWQNAAGAAPVELHDAEMKWYRGMTADVSNRLTRAGVSKEMAADARVQAYFADRSVQQGEGSIDAMGKHKARILAATTEAGGDPVKFLQNITEADREALESDFPTALATGVYSERGHDTRLDGRLKLALELPHDGEQAQLPGGAEGPYKNLSTKRRMELENKIRITASEKTQQDLRDSEAEIRRTGVIPVDDQGRTALDRAKNLLTKNQLEKHRNDWQKAQMEFNAYNDLDTLSDNDLMARLDELEPKAGEPLYDVKAKVFDTASKRVEKLRELRNTDPAGSVARTPGVTEASKAVREAPDDPDAVQNLARARIDAQAKIGIPEAQRSPITKAEAKMILAPIKGLEGKARNDALRETYASVERQYGPYARSVMVSAIDHAIHSKEQADEVEGLLHKSMQGLPVTAADQRRVEFMNENAQAMRAFGGEFVGEPRRQYGVRPTGDPEAGLGPENDAFTAYGLRPPPARAIEYLRQNPALAPDFERKYRVPASQFLLPDQPEKK